MKLYNNVKRVSDLELSGKILNDMLVLLAHKRANYSQPLSGLKQKYILGVGQDGIAYDVDEKTGKRTISTIQPSNAEVPILLNFKDNSTIRIAVKNGEIGETGRQGKEGPEGDKGANAQIDKERSANWLIIANDTVTEDNKKVLSALQGVKMMEQIKALSEIYMTDYQYSLLFTNHVTIEAEFETYEDGQLVQLIYEDPDSHQRYVKYWTFESEGEQEYFVLNHFKSTDEVKAYDSVYCDLWEDIFLGGTKGYFSATSNQLIDGSQLYVFDAKTKSYKPIEQFDESQVVYDKDGNRTNLDEYDWAYGERRFNYYLSAPDCTVNVKYTPADGYDFNLNAREIVLNIYVFDKIVDGNPTYVRIPKEQVDPKGNDTYYKRNEDGSFEEIERNQVASYIEKKELRYYKEIDDEWVEVESLDDIDTANWEEYIVVEYRKDNNTNIFTHYFHVQTPRGDNYYSEKSEILNPYTIEYFIYDDDRQYFTRRIKTVEDEEGNVTFNYEYTKITIPFWLEADFYTDVEDQKVKILNADVKYASDEEKQEEIKIESIIFSENFVTIAKNMNRNIPVTILPANANKTDMVIEYDENLITLYEDGRIAAVESDAVTTETTIVVYCEDNTSVSDTLTLKIVTPISKINFDTTKLNIYPGTTQKLNWTIEPAPENVSNSNISFEVSDPSMITIDKYGNVSPKVNANGEFTMGTCKIIATADDGFGAKTEIDVLVANPIKSLSIPKNIVAFIGKLCQIDATIMPDDATEKSLNYESSDSSISISSNGTFTPEHVNEFNVEVSTNDGSNLSAVTNIKVKNGIKEIKFYGFDFDTLNIGLEKEIEFELIPARSDEPYEAGAHVSLKNITTKEEMSTDEKLSFTTPTLVEGYDNRYKTTITGLSHGIVQFEVQSVDGSGIIAVKELQVTVPMSEIILGETTITMYLGDSKMIRPVIGPDNTYNTAITWHTSNERIATVDVNGRVTAASVGTCVISAISSDGNGIVASCTVTIKKHVDSILLNGGEGSMKVVKGNYGFISASVTPDDATDQILVWKSSNEDVCTVEDNGTVFAKSIGEATITATSIDLGESPATSSIDVQVVNKIDD